MSESSVNKITEYYSLQLEKYISLCLGTVVVVVMKRQIPEAGRGNNGVSKTTFHREENTMASAFPS
jgi:hypothetical protein